MVVFVGLGKMHNDVHKSVWKMVTLMPASWNQIAGWLKQIDNLRQAA